MESRDSNSADAGSLNASIDEYKTQVSAIDELLNTVSESTTEHEELMKVRSDLIELIEVTEGQLVHMKQSELITQLENINDDKETTGDGEYEPVMRPSTSGLFDDSVVCEEDEINDSDAIDDCDSVSAALDLLVGMQCRAPYGRDFGHKVCGGLRTHVAVVLELLSNGDKASEGCDLTQMKAKVLYCHPMYRDMKPCQFFLNDKCNYGDRCRYSHGAVVKLGDLLEYEVPETNLLPEVDRVYLVQPSEQCDVFWSLGRVTAIDSQQQQAAVCLLDSDQEVAVSFNKIVAVDKNELEQLPASDNGNHDKMHHSSDVVDDDTSPDTVMNAGAHKMVDTSFGDWEKHTKGIGSKLLAKMGFTVGEGLGKDSSGMIEPIEPKIMPKGKSLDKCMEIRAKHGAKDLYHKVKQEKRRQELREKRQRDQLENGIFSFLNRRLAHKPKKKIKAKDSHKQLKGTSDKGLNVALLKLDDQVKQLNKEAHRYKESVKRLAERDEISANKMRQKLDAVRAKLKSCESERSRLVNEKTHRTDKRKLAVF